MLNPKGYTMNKKTRQVKHLRSVKKSEMFSMKILFLLTNRLQAGVLSLAPVNFNWTKFSVRHYCAHIAQIKKGFLHNFRSVASLLSDLKEIVHSSIIRRQEKLNSSSKVSTFTETTKETLFSKVSPIQYSSGVDFLFMFRNPVQLFES